jgi:hypothetical protein
MAAHHDAHDHQHFVAGEMIPEDSMMHHMMMDAPDPLNTPFDEHGHLKLETQGKNTTKPPFCKPMRMGGGMIMYMDGTLGRAV